MSAQAGDEPAASVLQHELEEAQAARLRQEIEHEQAVSDALARVAELERQLENERRSKGELKSKEEGVEQSLSHLREEYNALQSSLAAESSKTSLLTTQLSSVEAQNRSLQGSVAALEGERARAQAEVTSGKDKVARWEVRVREVVAEAESKKIESRNFKFKVEALELNLQMANKDNATLTNSITRLTSDFANYRSTAQSQAQSASLELQTVQAALTTSQASLNQLTSSQSQLSNRLTSSQTEIATLRTQLVEQKAAFKQEIASQQRLAQSAERRAEDARKRLEEVEHEWEEDLARRKEGDIRTDEERLVWEEQRAELEAKVAELRDTVDRLVESGITGDADALPDDSDADRGAMLMSPSAALAGSLMRKRGMGISELYVENVRTKTELSKQQEETRRLEDSMEELLRDIQERAPLLRQQRQEYTRLVATANDLAGQLSVVTTERDAETRRAGDESAKVKQLQAAQLDLESHISDLSRQVVSLVREIGIRDEPFLAGYQHLADADMNLPEGDDIDSVITRNLIVFRSIPDLQAQNQQLIKVVRELGKQLEAAEKAGPTDGQSKPADDAEALAMMDEAGEIILGLKAKVEEKEVALAKQTRERDLFAKMLSQAGLTLPAGLDLEAAAGSGGALLDVVKRNLEDFRVELGLDSERLRSELAEARKEVNAASVALVRVEAERDFLKDRITALTEANSLQKIQFDGLVTQNQGVKTDLMRVNMELRQAEEKRIEVEGVAERARLEAANLRAEKELWKATEEKLQKDVADVARDRAGLQSLIEGLRRAEAETLRVQEETRLTAQQTISNLQTERDDLRKELDSVSSKAASAAAYEAERDQARLALASSNEAVERASAEKAAAEQQLSAAKIGFEEEKTRYIGAERKRSEKIFSDNKRFFQQQKDWTVKESELRAQLASLETRLAESETKLAEASAAQAAAASAAPSAEALEASVLSSGSYLSLQKERDELLKARDESLASAAAGSGSEEAVKTLASELEVAKAELAKAKATAETEKATYISSERSRYQNVFNDNKRFRAEIAQFKKDIEALTTRATTAETAAAAVPAAATEGNAGAVVAAPPSDEIIKAAIAEAVANLKAEHESTLAERERQLREELAASAPSITPTGTDGSAEVVDAAVKAALAGKEEELKAQHDAAILVREMELKAELEAAVKSAVETTQAAALSTAPPAVDVDAAVKAAVAQREAELKTAHEAALQVASDAAAAASGPAPSREEMDAAIAQAVTAAVAKATSEATSKAGAQKMALDTARKKKEKAEAELKALKAEMEALKAGGTPKGSPTTKTTTLPKTGGAPLAAPKRAASVSSAPDAAKAAPVAGGPPATRAKPATTTTTTTPQPSTSTPGETLPTKPAGDAGTSIRGAGRGRGARPTTRGRGAAMSSPVTRGTAAAASKAGGDGTVPPPRSLIGGALNQATSSSMPGAGGNVGTKRSRAEEDANSAALNNTLLGRLNKPGMIKRPKTDNSGGGAGEGGSGGGSPSS